MGRLFVVATAGVAGDLQRLVGATLIHRAAAALDLAFPMIGAIRDAMALAAGNVPRSRA